MFLLFPFFLSAQVSADKKQDDKTVKTEKEKSQLKSNKKLKKNTLKNTTMPEKKSNGKGVLKGTVIISSTEQNIKQK